MTHERAAPPEDSHAARLLRQAQHDVEAAALAYARAPEFRTFLKLKVRMNRLEQAVRGEAMLAVWDRVVAYRDGAPAPDAWQPDEAFLRVQDAGVRMGVLASDAALVAAFEEAVLALGHARGVVGEPPKREALVVRTTHADGSESVTVIPHPGDA